MMKQTRWSYSLQQIYNPPSYQKYCVLLMPVESEGPEGREAPSKRLGWLLERDGIGVWLVEEREAGVVGR